MRAAHIIVYSLIALALGLLLAVPLLTGQRPTPPTYDPELREVNDRLQALEMAVARFSLEHGNIMSDQAKAGADLSAAKAKLEMIAKQLSDLTVSGTPIDSGRLAALETKINLLLWFFGSAAAAVLGIEIMRLFAAKRRRQPGR